MNRRTMGMLAVAMTLALGGCASTPTVSSDVTAGTNFNNYHSYTWVNALPPAGMNPVAYERIKLDIQNSLASKGYHQAEPGDLSLILTVGAKDKTDINTWGRWGQQVDVYQYTEGKVSLDAFDTKTKQPLWHGAASQTIDPNHSDPALIDTAVAAVMAKFPAHS